MIVIFHIKTDDRKSPPLRSGLWVHKKAHGNVTNPYASAEVVVTSHFGHKRRIISGSGQQTAPKCAQEEDGLGVGNLISYRGEGETTEALN